MRGLSVSLVMALTLFLAAGCGDDGSNTTTDSAVNADSAPSGDAGVPSASFKGVDPYDVAQASLSLETETSAAVTKVELLVDGKAVAEATTAPFTISWDTTKTPDGIVKLGLKAYAGSESAESAELPVVVLNNGEEVTFTEGNATLDMTINPAPADNDLKLHWTMPSGVKQVIGAMLWDSTDFKMELALGTGNCPHSGQQACASTADTSPVDARFPDTAGTSTLGEVMWFIHAKATNATDIEGKTCKVTFKAFLLK